MPTAELGMYPFQSVRWAWDALWSAVCERVDWLPKALAHSGNVQARWSDPACVVNHVCGWPLARNHADDQRVVGAFTLTIPGAHGHRYRSTLVSTRETSIAELLSTPDLRIVANGADSLSGWISLLHATVGERGALPGEVVFTGAHVASLGALDAGDADLACIDSWSLALIERELPQLVASLHAVGFGPWIPSPAVTVRTDVPEADGEQFATAMADVLADAGSEEVREALFVDGFVRLSIDEYLPVLALRSEPG